MVDVRPVPPPFGQIVGQAQQALRGLLDEVLEAASVSHPTWLTLNLLAVQGPTMPAEQLRRTLAEGLSIELSEVSELLSGLEAAGHIELRGSSAGDEVALTNAGVCLRGAKRLEEAEQKFAAAIKARPNYSEATVQLASLLLEQDRVDQARKVVDTYLNAFRPHPDVLYTAVGVARAAKDKLAEEKYSRALRLEFPESAQARALKRGS